MEGHEKDYTAIPQLDTYEHDGIDEQQYSDIEADERRLAERQMNERDRAR